MREFIALIFDDPFKADEARIALFRLEGEGLIQIFAAAVITRRADGRTRLTQDTNVVGRGRKAGRLTRLMTAAVSGLLPRGFVGAAAGRVFGMLTNYGVSRTFIRQVAAKLEPGTSALVVRASSDLARRANMDERLRALAPQGLGANCSLET